MTDRLPVVVGVDGSSGSNAALRYAAQRAKEFGRPLKLIHVAPTFIPAAGLGALGAPYLPQEFEEVGRMILDDALTVGRGLLPRGQVSGRLLSGPIVAELVAAAHRAYEVVLGADHMPLIARIAIGSAVSGVAAGSPVPVIVVPDFWSAQITHTQRIVVGIRDPAQVSAPLVRAAFQLAREQHCTLDFVHVWDLAPRYASIIDTLADYPAWQAAVEHHIRRAIAPIHREFPDVAYVVTPTHGQPVPVLHERAAEAALLLLAREPHHTAHFGHTGRTLLRTSQCPVEVIPLPNQKRAGDDSAAVEAAHSYPAFEYLFPTAPSV